MSDPHDPGTVDLRAELEKRRTWFYECQLRGLNTQSFRDIATPGPQVAPGDPFPDRRIELISEHLYSWGFPAGQFGTLKDLGPVYLDSQEAVWTADEHTRRNAFSSTLIGDIDNWLGYKAGTRLAAAATDLKVKFEKSRFASISGPAGDLDPDLVTFARFGPGVDYGSMGRAVSRAKLAETRPWLIPELYNGKNVDTRPVDKWIENLELFIAAYESELAIAVGGVAGVPVPGDPTEGDAYRDWIKFLMDVAPARDVADALKARMFTSIPTADGKSTTFKYDVIQIETNGYPMGAADRFPFSPGVGYWCGVFKGSLGEVYVSKANSDMGLCSILRVIYQLGTLPAGLGADADLAWRRRQPPGAEFDAFFAQKANDDALKNDATLARRLQVAQAKLRVILEEAAVHPRVAPPTFSPLAQEVVRQGVRAFKFWMDEPFRPSDNSELQKARGDTGIAKDDEITSDMEYWSENHYIMFASSEYLAGQLWEQDQFQPAKEFLGDPKQGILTGQQRKERGRARVLRWLNNRLMFGWTEFNSSGYYREHLWSILNLADFALDQEVREKARMAVDLLLFDVARYLHKGTMGAAGGRSQFKSHSSGWDNALCDAVEIAWGPRGIFGDVDSQIGMALATSTYQVPDVLLEIGSRPPGRWTDRSRVSITFEEAPKYGIGYSQKTDQRDSVWLGYLPKRQRFFAFMQQVNDEIARTHTGYGAAENDIVFWWGTSAWFNHQVVRGTFNAVNKYGLQNTGIFGTALPGLIKLVAAYEKTKHGLIGGLIGSFAGPVGTVAGAAIGFFEDDLFGNDLEEAAGDDLSVLLEGSTRTRANILTFRTPDVMLSSIQNWRAGQFNFQSCVHQASIHPALSVFTTGAFDDVNISDLTAAIGGSLLGAAIAVGLSVVTGGAGAVLIAGLAVAGAAAAVIANEAALKGKKQIANDEDGPGWWTGYWALPMVVQHDSASIIIYDFHEIQTLLSDTRSHVWFPKDGFDSVEERRTSAYDNADFPLLDIGHIGKKGFWLFGKVIHPAVGQAEPGEGYIGVFSNNHPQWLDQGSDFYKQKLDAVARQPFDDGMGNLKKLLDDIEDGDSGSAGRDAVKAAVDKAVVATYIDGISAQAWKDAANAILDASTDPQVKANLPNAKAIAGVEVDLEIQQRVWPDPLPRDYFADRDWSVDGKNIWILQVGSKQEFGEYQTFKDRVSQARVHISDNGDQECSYDIPQPDGSSRRLTVDYGDGGQFQLDGGPFQTDRYPRFENPFVRGGRVEWGQREYVLDYNGKTLLHDISEFSQPVRQDPAPSATSDDRNTVRALLIFLRTGDENMDTWTVATADVQLGCVQGTLGQVVAAGPVADNTDHDAEWIFLDAPAVRAPDMTLTLEHPAASVVGNDQPHWKISFTLRALMGDRALRDCALSFSSFEFVDEKRKSPAFPFSIPLEEWRPWDMVSDDKPLNWWTIAQPPTFDTSYQDGVDLIGRDAAGALWHWRLRSCRNEELGWFALPSGGSGGPDLTASPLQAAAATTSTGGPRVIVQSAGRLFVTWPSAPEWWHVGWQPLDVFIRPDGALGFPDPSSPAIPIDVAPTSPVAALPSASWPYGIEILVVGADGHIYSHPNWWPLSTDPWRKIDVVGFALKAGQDLVMAGDRLLVLADDGELWGTTIDHSSRLLVPAWELLSPPGVAVAQVIATSDSDGTCQVMFASPEGHLTALTYQTEIPTPWVALDLPGTTLAPGSTLAATVPSTGSARFLAVGADGRIYDVTCDAAAGWAASPAWSAVEADAQGFTPMALGRLAAISRIKGQVEVLTQADDQRLWRAWWS
ncbi:hypothetical protein [Paraburkholderia sp. CI3]|uniref:hypothetical protein n=1 Tax=Paraburkholderia sp. CI3 TaxID=2991060 RepID=UPI003D1AA477